MTSPLLKRFAGKKILSTLEIVSSRPSVLTTCCFVGMLSTEPPLSCNYEIASDLQGDRPRGAIRVRRVFEFSPIQSTPTLRKSCEEWLPLRITKPTDPPRLLYDFAGSKISRRRARLLRTEHVPR